VAYKVNLHMFVQVEHIYRITTTSSRITMIGLYL
jgi:hypothetical protein